MILCIGDSFTYGEELSDPHRQAWPNLLADTYYGVDVLNLGKPGASNDWIFTTAIERTAWERYDVVIVQWTDPGRIDLSISGNDIQGVNSSTQRLNKTDKKWLDKYYKEFYDDEYAWRRTITQIIALQNYFKSTKQPYVMTSMNTIIEKRSMFYTVSGAIDTETLGLNPKRDRLCLVQLSTGDGTAHIVQFERGKYDAPNLKKLMTDETVTKIFHFARFDVAVMKEYLNIYNHRFCRDLLQER